MLRGCNAHRLTFRARLVVADGTADENADENGSLTETWLEVQRAMQRLP